MKVRFIFVLFISLILYCVDCDAHISNMIVFGDSLSDIGNFPESPTVSYQTAQSYVPFANPVINTPHNPYLPKSKRPYRSMGWSQYFLVLAKKDGLIKTMDIAPSNYINNHTLPQFTSVNYAWGYATSAKGCVNPHYHPTNNCTIHTVKKALLDYNQNPSQTNYQRIQIPGLFQQIHFFVSQYRAHQISVNNKTIYVIWIGGNDLISANNALMNHFNPIPAFAFLFGNTAARIIKNCSTLINSLPVHKRPNVIYVFALFNPALTPEYHHTILGNIANMAIHCANFWLTIEAHFFNRFSKTQIIIVPLYHWYAKAAENPAFHATLGQSCQQSDHSIHNECRHYLFWNAVHPATPMQLITATRFLQLISKQ